MGGNHSLNRGLRWSFGGYLILTNPNTGSLPDYRNGVTPFGLDVVAHQSLPDSSLLFAGEFAGHEFLIPSPVALRPAANHRWKSMHRDPAAVVTLGGLRTLNTRTVSHWALARGMWIGPMARFASAGGGQIPGIGIRQRRAVVLKRSTYLICIPD